MKLISLALTATMITFAAPNAVAQETATNSAISVQTLVTAKVNGMAVYEPAYQESFARHTLALLGLERAASLRDDLLFLQDFYAWMTESGAIWPQVFFDWFGGEASQSRAKDSPQAALYDAAAFAKVRDQLYARTPDRPDRLSHAYCICFDGGRPDGAAGQCHQANTG